MLGPSHHAYIFRHHFAHMILVSSTECPAMPTSTPLLDALKAEEFAQGDKDTIQRRRLHYKVAAQAFKKDESKKKAAGVASGAASEPKEGGESTALLGIRAAKRPRPVRRRPLRLDPRRNQGWKRICCQTYGQTIAGFSQQRQVWARWQAPTQTTVHVTKSSRIDGPFIFESPHRLWYPHCASTCTFPCACAL